jgi:hypothetical protein
MMRFTAVLLAFVLAAAPGFAGSISVASGGSGTVTQDVGGTGTITVATASGAGGGYSDVKVYFNCDADTTPQTPSKGNTNSVTVSSPWTVDAGMTGNSLNNANDGFEQITISTYSASGGTQIDWANGRVGFYFMPLESGSSSASDGNPVWAVSTTGGKWFFDKVSSSNPIFYYGDASATVSATSLTSGSTTYIEIAWDYDSSTLGAPCKVYKNGVLAATCGALSSATVPAATTMKFSGFDANQWWAKYDQILISSDPTRDLYAVRDLTSFP